MSVLECPECGTSFDRQLTAGLCPRCLLTTGSQTDTDAECGETLDTDASGAKTADAFEMQAVASSFAGYDLIEEIARGGMGVVYRARDQKLGRDVALKVILSGQFASASDVRRFYLEAESAASLDHPGVVPIYEIGEHDGHHYFTMKLIDGGSLAGAMPELRRDPRQFADKVAQVAEAIDYAHRRGILHRDIKPANILISEDGRPLVTDLGLAKRIQADSDLTGTGAIVGTPAYMPPEQASGSKEVTTAADVFAIGAILYEGLVGHPPYQAESAVRALVMAAKGDIKRPCEIDRKVDKTLELICMKCLATDPKQRYASAGLLAEDIRHWLAGEPVSVRPRSLVTVFGGAIASQLRSVLGAMLIGAMGGLAFGIPLFSRLARQIFGENNFHITQLQKTVPSTQLGDSWWLHMPEWLGPLGILFGLGFTLALGVLLNRLVRPQDTKQAIAIGLVAGLLMTIVQFGFFGIAAGWQSYRMQSGNEIATLAEVGFGAPEGRSDALNEIYTTYPDVKALPQSQQAKVLSDAMSVRIMMASPKVFISVLLACLAISTISCVAGTAHAQRLGAAEFGLFDRSLRYTEVMVLLMSAAVMIVFCLFTAFGMYPDTTLTMQPIVRVILLLVAATIPILWLPRWYIRWPIYIVGVVLVFVV